MQNVWEEGPCWRRYVTWGFEGFISSCHVWLPLSASHKDERQRGQTAASLHCHGNSAPLEAHTEINASFPKLLLVVVFCHSSSKRSRTSMLGACPVKYSSLSLLLTPRRYKPWLTFFRSICASSRAKRISLSPKYRHCCPRDWEPENKQLSMSLGRSLQQKTREPGSATRPYSPILCHLPWR